MSRLFCVDQREVPLIDSEVRYLLAFSEWKEAHSGAMPSYSDLARALGITRQWSRDLATRLLAKGLLSRNGHGVTQLPGERWEEPEWIGELRKQQEIQKP